MAYIFFYNIETYDNKCFRTLGNQARVTQRTRILQQIEMKEKHKPHLIMMIVHKHSFKFRKE